MLTAGRTFPDLLPTKGWRDQLAADEQELLHDADVVFCSAKGLCESRSAVARGRTVLLRNAVDLEHFLASEGEVAPEDVRTLPRPIVGYVGALAEWVDFELLREVALERPNWSLVLVGPAFDGEISGDSTALNLVRDLPNVHMLGPRPYEQVPRYVHAFDVATIPFKVNGLTEDTNPIKLYEYLAAGVPVVSTRLPEVEQTLGARLATTPAEFVAEVEAAISDARNADQVAARVAVGRSNSWGERAERAWETIEGALADKQEAATAEPRPKVLIVSTDLPWPMDSGWRIRAFENVRAISSFADATLIALAEPEDASSRVAALKDAVPGLRVLDPVDLRIHIREQPLLLARAAIAGLITGRPYKVAKFSSSEMRRRLRRLCSAERFDVVHAELATLPYAWAIQRRMAGTGPSVVLDEHNVESQLLYHHWQQGQFGRLGPLVRVECARTRRFERAACLRADLVLTISEEDRLRLAAMTGAEEGSSRCRRSARERLMSNGRRTPRAQQSCSSDRCLGCRTRRPCAGSVTKLSLWFGSGTKGSDSRWWAVERRPGWWSE